MTKFNKYALVAATALALSSGAALANTPYNDCPYQDGRCQNYSGERYHHNNYKGHKHSGYHKGYNRVYLKMQRFLDNPKYAKDAMHIIDVSDALYAERQVLRSLERAQEPDVKEIRKQALTVRKMERQYFDLKRDFFKKVRAEDPDLLNYKGYVE